MSCFAHARVAVTLLILSLLALPGCEFRTAAVPAPLQPHPAPRETPVIPQPTASTVHVPEGYRIEAVLTDLTYPSSAEFDEAGNLYIAEAGYVYGDHHAPTRIWRVTPEADLVVVADRGLTGPINDLLWHDGRLYISHRGKISVLEGSEVQDLVTDLPSLGDHQNNQLTAGPDGKLYFGQGTATNAGVVGLDNFLFLWLPQYPNFHDRPARPIVVRGQEYATLNPFIMAGGGLAGDQQGPMLTVTGAFRPFGGGAGDDAIPGTIKANGTILRMNPDGSDLEVYAWGLRNPFGVMWVDGTLYASENGFDERGSRPIANDVEDLYVIHQGAWYGWPDFAAGIPVTDERFVPEGGPAPEFLMAEHPPVEKPLMTFPPHSAVTKLAASPGAPFGETGHLFLTIWGSMTPMTGHPQAQNPPLGPSVLRVDPQTRQARPFARNAGDGRQPLAGLRRPMDVIFSPDGEAMYIVDLGAFEVMETPVPMPAPFPGTGVVWRIVPEAAEETGPPAGLSVLRRHEEGGRTR